MCLKVATKRLVAKTDLLVYKCLDGAKKHYTPFKHLPIEFDESGKCIIDGGDEALTIEKKFDVIIKEIIDVINIGIHAYTKKDRADYIAEQLFAKQLFIGYCYTKVYYAVIPKGCHYYIGVNFDVVSTQLIVFRSKRFYDKYKKEHEVKEL